MNPSLIWARDGEAMSIRVEWDGRHFRINQEIDGDHPSPVSAERATGATVGLFSFFFFFSVKLACLFTKALQLTFSNS